MKIAILSSLLFDLAPSAIDLVTGGVDEYNTPEDLRVDINQIVRANYLDATLKGSLVLSASDSVTVTVRLTDGATDFVSESVAIAAGTRADFSFSNINLKRAVGGVPLYIAVDVDAAASSATGQIFAQLLAEYPVVISE